MAPKIFKETCRIDWNQTAKRVYDFVRGLSPYPGAWTTIEGEGMKPAVLKIFKTTKTRKDIANASTGDILTENGRMWMAAADQWLQIEELQLAGKKRMDARSFVNGLHATGLRICPTQD